MKFHRLVLTAFVLLQCASHAYAATEPSTPIISTISALMLVLVAIGVVAVLAKRFVPGASTRAGLMRVVSQLTVGPHERISIVEINGQWLVLGVTAHQVNLITQMQALEKPDAPLQPASFGSLFTRLAGKRNET